MFKTRMIRTAATLFAVGAVSCFLAGDASAQNCGYGGYGGGYGGYGYGYGGGYGSGISLSVGGGRGVSFSSYRPVYRRPTWHDTSHLDYYRGGFVPHGYHYDYVPGHYRVHRTGHYHH